MFGDASDYEQPSDFLTGGCCETSREERIEAGKGEYPFGTTGTVSWWPHPKGRVPAVVLYDMGTACGGGDDIRIAYNYSDSEWAIDWFGAYDFEPDKV